jgi:hypothetical protein
MIGVVIKILPSLLKKMVIKKHKTIMYRNNLSPEPFALLTRLTAAHRNTPILSNTIHMTMVEIMVMDGPLTSLNISRISLNGTTPATKSSIAPMIAGMASFIPRGLHMIKRVVIANIVNV